MDFAKAMLTWLIFFVNVYVTVAPLPNRAERAAVATIDSVLQRITSGLSSIRRFLRMPNRERLQAACRQEEDLHRNLYRVRNLVDINDFQHIELMLDTVKAKLNEISAGASNANGEEQNLQDANANMQQAHSHAIARRGTFYDLDRNRLAHFLNIGFSVRYIARNAERLLGGSFHYNTLHRYISRHHLTAPRQRFTDISDDDLRAIILGLNRQYQNSGAAEMLALLRSRTPSIIVPRDRCRRVLADMDPESTARCWAQAIR